MENKETPTIGMLLDIESYYGDHEGRLAPVIATLCACGAPILIYFYFSLFLYLPWFIFIPLELIWSIWIIALIPGRQGYRLQRFRTQLYDEYTAAAELMNIKTIYEDGCIEFVNGVIMYLVVCYNGTIEDQVQHSVQLRRFLDALVGDNQFDIYLHNITDSPALLDYYDKIKIFGRNESADNFIDIIDHNIKKIEDNSMVQCTIYAIKGRRSDWKDIKLQIDTACKSKTARVYKSVSRVEDTAVISDIINRNITTVINIDELTRKKYATQNYGSSKVLVYDLKPDEVVIQGEKSAEPVIKEPVKNSFHTVFKEE